MQNISTEGWDVQTGCTGYLHVTAIRMMGIVNVLQLIMSLVSVYETGFVLRREA